ncbi:carboxypeptidase regulatory-like domain-containing protein [Pseudomonas sp. RTC3]|uniref:carboxypeptidase regulatory-like domain-containing protein n=1 Tax=unclassified Pseudomonas TaxID=196821 RepID=UPI002AB41E9D|nr:MULTISPECIES: carboxypeptidase regulatory-like domain-containing protein [unclassified Pseudomonas]MEB0064818.1 carboxypeptidase regulatory-like domain-containing protein [Pseudomonas sp. RTC3]MDY7568102.1 carboxypeptidase regulatory-like domain-containing protein [Pseudomonas sp. 5C2]MEB0005154.1 carboxypeptidase regulatory-like domain-containing protein [Pseudomonas sp. RTB2]MEB0019079.1 carboxypeptidase regulatory-like domain-containing protein [Pseudomonas sp. RTB3]MEB0024223.1 carboxyp
MTSVRGLTPSRVVLAVLLSFSPVVLQAANEVPIDMSAVQLEPKEQNGITYLSGGVGQDESQAIQQVKGYNLHITFSIGPDNKYLSGVDVVIQTAKGRSIVSLSQVGPIVYVKLPADNYLIIASQNGHEKRSTVVLEGSSTGTVNLHWSD